MWPTRGEQFEQTWERSIRWCFITNIKALGLMVSVKKIYFMFISISLCETCDPRAGAIFVHWGLIWTSLVDVYLVKLQISRLGRQEDLSCFPCISLCKNWDPPGVPLFALGHNLNKLGKVSLGDAIYQISRLYAFRFKTRRSSFSCFSLSKPLLKNMTPMLGPSCIIWTNLVEVH